MDFPGLGLLDPGHSLCVGSGLWWFERHWALAGDAGGAAGAADFLCQAERQRGHFLGFFPWERLHQMCIPVRKWPMVSQLNCNRTWSQFLSRGSSLR